MASNKIDITKLDSLDMSHDKLADRALAIEYDMCGGDADYASPVHCWANHGFIEDGEFIAVSAQPLDPSRQPERRTRVTPPAMRRKLALSDELFLYAARLPVGGSCIVEWHGMIIQLRHV